VIALHQSRASSDRCVRRALATIARDETRHAALALRTFAWAVPLLDDRARVEVARVLEDAIAALQSEETPCAAPELGLPDVAAMRTLAASLDVAVWRPLQLLLGSSNHRATAF